LYTFGEGKTASDFLTCSTIPPTSKSKSELYHGGLSDGNCNMDDDRITVYEEWKCSSNGPYQLWTAEFKNGVNPISCTESYTCSSFSTYSNDQFRCTTSLNPSDLASSNRPTSQATRAGLKGGKLAGVIVAVAVGLLMGLVKSCCYGNSNAEQDDQDATSVVVHQSDAESEQNIAAEPRTADSMPTMPMESKKNLPPPSITQSIETIKFCSKCGASIVSGRAFCASCGKAVRA